MQPNDFNADAETFFRLLLQDTEKAYQKSDIIQTNPHWAYSVCATPIVKNEGLIVGLNWGGGNNEEFKAQAEYPKGDDVEKYPFIMKLAPYLKDHLKVADVKKINYSNLCFFRSPKVSDLKQKDWECSQNLIQNYVKYVNPSWILLVTTNLDRAKDALSLDENPLPFQAGTEKVFTAYKSTSRVGGKTIPFYALPHPNAHIKAAVRKILWNEVLPIETSTIGLPA